MDTLKDYIEKFDRLCETHPSCAYEATQQIATEHPDGTPKTEWDYYSDLVWACYGIISSGGEHSC